MKHPRNSNQSTTARHQAVQAPHDESSSTPRAMAAFEIQIRKDRDWTVAATFEDRDLAILEAGQLDASLRYSAVRIVEPVFNKTTGEFIARTILRCGNAKPGGTPARKRRTSEGETDDSAPSPWWTMAGLRQISRRPAAIALAGVAMVLGLLTGLVLGSIA